MDRLATYEESFRLRISDYDCNDKITPVTILDLAQDVAGKHADILNIGYEEFIKNNNIWVLIRTRLEMFSYPLLYSTLKVKTWPRVKGRVDFDRDTLITDENDNIVCKLQSKWVVINYVNRNIVLPRNINYPIVDFCEDKNFDTPFNKIDDFDISNLNPIHICTRFNDLDHNGHVNNIKYVQYIMNELKLEKNIFVKTLEIDYIHELKAYEEFDLYIKKTDDLILTKGVSNGKDVFLCEIQCEKRD